MWAEAGHALARQLEVADQRRQVGRGGARRERLVGLVREDDQARRGRRCRESDLSVAPIREKLSEEMLAERSSTITTFAFVGSGTNVCECGDRGGEQDGDRAAATAAASAASDDAGGDRARAEARGASASGMPRSLGPPLLDSR